MKDLYAHCTSYGDRCTYSQLVINVLYRMYPGLSQREQYDYLIYIEGKCVCNMDLEKK